MDETTLLYLGQHLQAELELDMKQSGLARFRAMMANVAGKNESSAPAGQRLIAGTLRAASAAIDEARRAAEAGKPQHRALAVELVKEFSSDALAFLTGRAMIDGYAGSRSLATTARHLGQMIEEEQRLGRFEEANPGAFEWTMRRIRETSGRHRQLSVTRHLMNLKKVEWTGWSNRQQTLAGMWLIDQFNGATGLFTVELVYPDSARGGKGVQNKHYVLAPTPETVAWMDEAVKRLELNATDYWPTIIKPRPWTKPWGGGYHTKLIPTLTLVKTRRDAAGKAYMDRLKHTDLGYTLEAVNACQDTAWKINQLMLAVLSRIEAGGLTVEGLAPGRDEELPEHPYGGDKDRDPDAHKQWCKRMSITHRKNRNMRGKRVALTRTLTLARRFAQYPELYFPHTMDFRGRLYPVPAFLNPQGADFQKSLLTFAHGKPIDTEEQLEWLAIHGANCYGIDKVPFTERWNWVVDHYAAIHEAVESPFGDGWDFWTKADSPFQFLAWAFDFCRVVERGYGTVSSIPVALDGSCNGLQHYSAALRDPVGGSAVNLTPSERPKDIYALVAERALRRLAAQKDISGSEGELARSWLSFGVTRKTTKRSVMTLPYGCSIYSVREFIEDAMKEQIAGGAVNPFVTLDDKGQRKDGLFDASKFLTRPVWDSIGDTVVAAREGMGWLQVVAKHASRSGAPIYWTTPDGFPVQQAYPIMRDRQIETRFHGKAMKPRIQEETDQLDRNRQRNGIAPNWVHSMDGCALRMFLRLAVANGVSAFAVIHDSYGAPAADVPVISWALREAFFQMYDQHDVLQDFADEVLPTIAIEEAEEIPPVPRSGTLDLGQLYESLYFFA